MLSQTPHSKMESPQKRAPTDPLVLRTVDGGSERRARWAGSRSALSRSDKGSRRPPEDERAARARAAKTTKRTRRAARAFRDSIFTLEKHYVLGHYS